MRPRRRWCTTGLALSLLLFAACGIKAPPRPPLDERVLERPSLVDSPDAGCCAAVKR